MTVDISKIPMSMAINLRTRFTIFILNLIIASILFDTHQKGTNLLFYNVYLLKIYYPTQYCWPIHQEFNPDPLNYFHSALNFFERNSYNTTFNSKYSTVTKY